MRWMTTFWIGCLSICFFIVAEATARPATSGKAPASRPAPVEKIYVEFSRHLERAINTGNAKFCDKCIDLDALVAKSAAGLKVSAACIKDFRDGVEERFSFAKVMCDFVQKSGKYKLLRIRRINGRVCALFRLAGEDGLNYHDLLLKTDRKGRVKIEDLYVHMSGEWLSRTFRRGLLPLALLDKSGRPRKGISGPDADYIKNIFTIRRMQQLAAVGKFKDALVVYRALPRSVQRRKGILILRVLWATNVGDKELKSAIEAFVKAYPNDPAVDMHVIDLYFMKKQFDRVLKALNRVEKRVGGDPYLHYYRALIYKEKNQSAECKKWARRAIAEEQDMVEPYSLLLSHSLDEKDFKETSRLLTVFETRLGFEIEDLTKIAEYAEFVKSSEYKAWLKLRKKTVKH